MGFYTKYKAVFTAIQTAIATKSATIPTCVLGEQFTPGALPKAIINAEPSPIGQATMGTYLEAKVRGSVILVIRDYEPDDWFSDIISVMGDVMDALLKDRTLNGAVFDSTPTGFSPGEIKFQNKVYYGGIIRWEATLHYAP